MNLVTYDCPRHGCDWHLQQVFDVPSTVPLDRHAEFRVELVLLHHRMIDVHVDSPECLGRRCARASNDDPCEGEIKMLGWWSGGRRMRTQKRQCVKHWQQSIPADQRGKEACGMPTEERPA